MYSLASALIHILFSNWNLIYNLLMKFNLENSMFSTQNLSWRVVRMTPPARAFVINLKKVNPLLPLHDNYLSQLASFLRSTSNLLQNN